MTSLIKTFADIFSIKELKDKILYTLVLLLVFRLGSYVVLPGVDPDKLTAGSGGILGFLDLFLGGAFNRGSVFALGIMPYISASIVIQLLTVAMPQMQKMQKEGESGVKKLNQITRMLTIAVTLVQSVAYVQGTIPKEAIFIDYFLFSVSSSIILCAGTVLCMWLGEKITDRGIGNGISMLIMIGIVSRFPGSLVNEVMDKASSQTLVLIFEALAFFFIIMAVILITQAVRKVRIQYASQVVGGRLSRKSGAPDHSNIPIKVNTAGVMPIIFAQSLMFLPPLLGSMFKDSSEFAAYLNIRFSDFTSWEYNVLFAVLIILFTYFYTAITINPNQIAEDLRRSGGYIEGVNPGEDTSEYIGGIIDRITLPGALYLGAIAVLPSIAYILGVGQEFSQFYGGTSLLIMVGVVLDTILQIDTYLDMKRMEDMQKSGPVAGYDSSVTAAS